MYPHWVHFSCEKYLLLLRPPLPSVVFSKYICDSSIASDRTSLLKWFKLILLPWSVKSVPHQASAWSHFIFLSQKDIPTRLIWILHFDWQNYFISINLQHSTDSCVSYLYSTRTLPWSVMNPKVTWGVPVKTLFFPGVETCAGFIVSCG